MNNVKFWIELNCWQEMRELSMHSGAYIVWSANQCGFLAQKLLSQY